MKKYFSDDGRPRLPLLCLRLIEVRNTHIRISSVHHSVRKMSVWMLGRVETAIVRSQKLFALATKTSNNTGNHNAHKRLGTSLILVGGVLAFNSAQNMAFCEAMGDEKVTSFSSKLSQNVATKSFNGFGGGSGSNNSNSNSSNNNNDPVKLFLEKYSGFLQNLGFSGVMGICSGVALKKATRAVAATIGMVFMGLQTLNYLGYITIDYNKVTKDAQKVIDANGDGKIDGKDAVVYWEKLKNVLSYQLPQAGSFSTGFALGFYYF